jgi:hypothetical protein
MTFEQATATTVTGGAEVENADGRAPSRLLPARDRTLVAILAKLSAR